MVKLNRKSLTAKAYINGKVNDMRMQFSRVSNENVKKKLIETFREITSSDEYQENLKIINEDADVIRKYTKRKKGGDLTSQEFQDAKTEFYGKNMKLEFGENFEKLNLGEKLDYIFEKFGDSDYAADLMINLLESLMPKQRSSGGWDYILNIIDKLIGGNRKGKFNGTVYRRLSDNFGNGIVTARIYFYLGDYTNWGGGYRDWLDFIPFRYENMTEKTLKKLIETEKFKNYALRFFPGNDVRAIQFLIRACEDGSISDKGLIRELRGIIGRREINKLSPEGKKYYDQISNNVD